MKARIQILAIALLLPAVLAAQVSIERQVVASGGMTGSGTGLELSWTMGDFAVATLDDPALILTQGFQQGDANPVGIAETEVLAEFRVYPNPVLEQLTYEISSDEPISIVGFLIDPTGRIVTNIPELTVDAPLRGTLDLTGLATGEYLLRFQKPNGELVRTYSVLKVR